MSLDHTALQLAMRSKLLTLSVCTTGSVTLSATATGYARASGSFLTDGFAKGMEITPVGFAANTVDTITGVTALAVTTRNARSVEIAASARSLTVGLPALRLWENTSLIPIPQQPYVEEQYVPGVEILDEDGRKGVLELRPMYSPRVYVPANTDIAAGSRYADAIRRLFALETDLTIVGAASNEKCEVRLPPQSGQRAPDATSAWSCIPVSIFFRATTYSV